MRPARLLHGLIGIAQSRASPLLEYKGHALTSAGRTFSPVTAGKVNTRRRPVEELGASPQDSA